jgi:hypothetical protein
MSIPRVGFKVENNNPIVEFFKYADSELMPMFKMINETDEFKLQKYTGSNLEDVMTVNEDGVITFPKNVEFKGSTTTINSNTLTFQDQQVDLGLSDVVELDISSGSVTKASQSSSFIYTFKFVYFFTLFCVF